MDEDTRFEKETIRTAFEQTYEQEQTAIGIGLTAEEARSDAKQYILEAESDVETMDDVHAQFYQPEAGFEQFMEDYLDLSLDDVGPQEDGEVVLAAYDVDIDESAAGTTEESASTSKTPGAPMDERDPSGTEFYDF